MRLLHPRFPLYGVPRGGGLFRLGATHIESDNRKRRVRSVLELFLPLMCCTRLSVMRNWGRSVPIPVLLSADNLPHLRRLGDTIYVNSLFRHGLFLASTLARTAVETACDGSKPELMDENHS